MGISKSICVSVCISVAVNGASRASRRRWGWGRDCSRRNWCDRSCGIDWRLHSCLGCGCSLVIAAPTVLAAAVIVAASSLHRVTTSIGGGARTRAQSREHFVRVLLPAPALPVARQSLGAAGEDRRASECPSCRRARISISEKRFCSRSKRSAVCRADSSISSSSSSGI